MASKGVILRIALTAVFAAGFLLFLAPVTAEIINIGNAAGMTICAAFALVSAFFGRISPLIRENRALRTAAVVILCIGAILAVLAAVISAFMVKAANSPPTAENGGTIIVLGCRVRGDTPSLMLRQRIMAACEYMKENPEAVCIASGGQGADELISEAECIRQLLTENGIDGDRIILEERSSSTDENLRYSIEKMEEYGISGGVTIITNEFHQLRAKMIAEKYGLEVSAVSAETSLILLPTYWLREWFGVVYQFIFG